MRRQKRTRCLSGQAFLSLLAGTSEWQMSEVERLTLGSGHSTGAKSSKNSLLTLFQPNHSAKVPGPELVTGQQLHDSSGRSQLGRMLENQNRRTENVPITKYGATEQGEMGIGRSASYSGTTTVDRLVRLLQQTKANKFSFLTRGIKRRRTIRQQSTLVDSHQPLDLPT